LGSPVEVSTLPLNERMPELKRDFSSAKAVRELGLPQTDVREALRDAVEWFGAHGYTRVAPAVKMAAS